MVVVYHLNVMVFIQIVYILTELSFVRVTRARCVVLSSERNQALVDDFRCVLQSCRMAYLDDIQAFKDKTWISLHMGLCLLNATKVVDHSSCDGIIVIVCLK